MFVRPGAPAFGRRAIVSVIAFVGLALFAASQRAEARSKKKPGSAGAHHLVTIRGFKFDPDSITLKAGETVEWVNEDILPHTATAAERKFDSGPIGSKQHWKWETKEKGTYPYACTFHPTMKATVIVK